MQLPDEFAQECLDEIDKAKEHYAQAKANRERANTAVTIALARVTNRCLSGGDSFQKAQNSAKTHPDYEKASNDYADAVAEEVRIEWQLKILEMKFAGWRTISSNRRASL